MKAKAEGDRLLAQASASDLFDNETGLKGDGSAIALRHKASGYLCLFNPGKAANAVEVQPAERRGDAISCFTETFIGPDSRFIYRWDGPLRDAVGATMTALTLANKDRVDGGIQVSFSETLPPPLDIGAPNYASVAFKTKATYERAVLFPMDGWVVEGRFTTARSAEAGSKMLMDRQVYTWVAERNRRMASPTAATPSSGVPPWRDPGPTRRQIPHF